jgi:hypothetical protein
MHHTIIWGVFTAQDAKKRAFATAVEAHNADSVAFGKREGDIGKQRTVGSGCRKFLGIDHNHSTKFYG